MRCRIHLLFVVLTALCLVGCSDHGRRPAAQTQPGTTAASTPGKDGGLTPTPGTAAGEQGVRDVFRAWNRALASGDASYACSLMTGPGQRNIHEGYNITCTEALTRASADLDDEERRALSSLAVSTVSVKDASAEIRKEDVSPRAGAVGRFEFVRRDERWLIDSVEEHG